MLYYVFLAEVKASVLYPYLWLGIQVLGSTEGDSIAAGRQRPISFSAHNRILRKLAAAFQVFKIEFILYTRVLVFHVDPPFRKNAK